MPRPIQQAMPLESSDRARGATLIGRNFSFRLTAQVLSALINVGGMVLLGNYLSAEGYGNYAFYYALIHLIGSGADLGVGIITVKEIARDKANAGRHFGDALVIKAGVSGVLLLGIATSAWLVFDPVRATLICLVSATALIDFSQDASIWIFRAYERLDLESLLLMVSQILWVAGIALCILLQASLAWFLGSATIAFLIRLGVGGVIVSRGMCRPVFAPTLDRLKALVIQGLPFALAMFGVVLYGRIGILMLKTLSTDTDVAYFNVAYMLSQPLGFISSALSMAVFPALSRRAQEGPEAIRNALRRTSKYQVVVTLPMVVGLFLLSERLVPLLFRGEGFSQAGVALKIMSLGLTLIFFNLMSRYVLTAMDAQRVYLRAVVAALIANVALGAVLIRPYGFAGACVAQLGAELAIFVVCQLELSKYLSVAEILREARKPLVAAAGMGLLVFSIRGANVFLVAATGAFAYLGLLLWLKAFSPDELRILRGVYASFRLPGSAYLTRGPRVGSGSP
ncbi:MAG: flippase [Nitrospirae bacterium]|nr:flippase [Nitrospirota bacterium]